MADRLTRLRSIVRCLDQVCSSQRIVLPFAITQLSVLSPSGTRPCSKQGARHDSSAFRMVPLDKTADVSTGAAL
jgi:hypothetical protein